ncbi:hypothetical protein B0J17DRAFT_720194 [Rhizoctonia solani]|nr:hypothetical protein B0J17DRAFT_720194 [Rhizoctonia solani]
MARFSALSMLVTLLCFLFWATRVSTPSHSDMSLRTIEIVPLVFPVLTISAPPPVRSPCAGINRCDKSPVYSIWASRVVGSVNQARNCLTARNLIRPYLLQVGRYAHQVMHMLGRPTPDSLVGLVVLPTTGKLAAPPLEWARAEKGPVAHALPPPPPPPPTRTLPVYVPPAPTSGPWNPPTPTTGHARLRSVEPVVKIDSNDWFQHTVFIGLTLVLAAASFVLHFKVALSSVDCAEHRDTESDEVAVYCDDIRSVVPPMTKSSALQTFRKSNTKSTLRNQQDRLELSLVTLLTADREPVLDEMARQTLDLVMSGWCAPILYPSRIVPLIRYPLIGPYEQLNLASFGPLRRRPHDTSIHVGRIFPPFASTEQYMPFPVEWPVTTVEGKAQNPTPLIVVLIPTNTSVIHSREFVATFNRIFDSLRIRLQASRRASPAAERHTPLLREWYHTTSYTAKPAESTGLPSSPVAIFAPPTLISPITISSTHLLPRLTLRLPSTVALCDVLCLAAVQRPRVLPDNVLCQSEATDRHTQLLLDWRSEKTADVILPPTVVESSPSLALRLKSYHLYSTLSTQRPSHLLRGLTPLSYTHAACILPFDRSICHPPTQLLVEWHALPQVAQPLYDEVKTTDPESPTFPSASDIQLDHPSQPKAPPRIPPSFYRYANIRLEDLDAYPLEQRGEILHREIRVAEGRYRQEKPRRDRARFDSKWKRAEIEQKGGRPLARRKCTEELEEEEGLKKVMQARQRGEEEVFEGVGGPPRPVPEWLQALVEVVCDWGSSARMKKRMEDGMPKGILKRSASDEEGKAKGKRKGKGKKSKVVRWVDEFGRRLAR